MVRCRAIQASNVLVSGLNGLGVECAKNVLLGGVRSLTLHDTVACSLGDLSSQFYLTEQDVGKNRAEACVGKLQELNTSVVINVMTSGLTPASLAGFSVVVLVDTPLDESVALNEYCRSQSPPIKFIRVDVRGASGCIFADFGPGFVVNDTNGENPHSGIVKHITNASPAVVTVPDDEQVEFGVGEWVSFKGVEGMTELNNGKPVKVIDTKMYNFTIDLDTTKYPAYERKNMNTYGTVVEVKMPKELACRPLRESMEKPDFSMDPSGMGGTFDFDKFGRTELLHVLYLALDDYRRAHGGLPKMQDGEAAAEYVKFVQAAKARTGLETEIDEELVKKFARTAGAVLIPFVSIFGGIVGQEVAKAVSQKHHPVYQFQYLDAFEILGDYEGAGGEEFVGSGSRYDSQIGVLGRSVQSKMGDLKYFMVGCGALGCELFKNFAMMGIACGPGGMVTVTDDDVIEKSNLSRQFLFRNFNVGQSKSIAATNAVKAMNSNIKIDARQDRVSPLTEGVYNDAFWEGLDGVVNALDNVKARQYVDQRCVFFGKSLLESGTMGTKCNVQCVIPHRTINYGGRKDPETKEAPECALHNFPHNINHCLSLGRSEFVGIFETHAGQASQYLEKGPEFVSGLSGKIWGGDGSLLADGTAAAKEANEVLLGVNECLREGRGLVTSMEDCVRWARIKFEDYFSNKIKQLVFSCPHDMKNSSGAPFWSPPKRFPSAIAFDPEDPVHLGFIIAAANLKAQVYNLPGYKPLRDGAAFKAMLAKVAVPEFTPSRDAKIDTGEKKPDGGQQMDVDEGSVVDQAKQNLSELPDVARFGGLKISPLAFEKDDDTNFHMDFIGSFANLRARNYSIEEVDALQAKLIAGRIIPALATTTSLVTGFVCIELIKILQKGEKAAFKDLQCNLAIPMFMQIDPEGPPKSVARVVKTKPDPVNHPEYEEEEDVKTLPADGFTVWDKIVVSKGDITVQEFVDYWKSEHGMTCTAFAVKIGDAARPFYNQFMPGTKANLPLKMSDLYKKYDPTFTGKYFLPEVSLQDEDMNEVETPAVVFRLA